MTSKFEPGDICIKRVMENSETQLNIILIDCHGKPATLQGSKTNLIDRQSIRKPYISPKGDGYIKIGTIKELNDICLKEFYND